MQNMDFYEGRHLRDIPSQYDRVDPEFFTRGAMPNGREHDHHGKKATGMFTIITALIIVSFTAGLAIGIKFAGGSDRKIVDDRTMNAVSNISARMSEAIKEASSSGKTASEVYPKSEYPFVIQLSQKYGEDEIKNVARFLSGKGHTVIVSQNKGSYRIFTGPYKTELDAKKSLSEISLYRQYAISTNAQIIKRI
ncbi:MAG TPA: SPOR domain-containing protein [Spirochaetota bacterium]|mgnify:CR=1 FL=1|nr:SPOR domain-containing protein [Spirochaetota bacterium]HPJ35889.1 SPOR domain-containing protein [Spirochaetota bacterium]